MAIVDVENQIAEEKDILECCNKMRDILSKVEYDTAIYRDVMKRIEEETALRIKEIDRLEFSIVNERKNCSVCVWSESITQDVILCRSFASKNNGQYVQKNFANKCKQFHKTDGFFERR